MWSYFSKRNWRMQGIDWVEAHFLWNCSQVNDIEHFCPIKIGSGRLMAPNHYLSHCWPSSMSPHGTIRPQWVYHGIITLHIVWGYLGLLYYCILCVVLTVTPGIILYMRPVNERQHNIVTSSLIGWGHTQNHPCNTWYLCLNCLTLICARLLVWTRLVLKPNTDSQDSWDQNGAHLGPTGPRWPHVGPMNFALWGIF